MDGTVAPAVASAVKKILMEGLEPSLAQLLQQLQVPVADPQLLRLGALLRLHTAAHRCAPTPACHPPCPMQRAERTPSRGLGLKMTSGVQVLTYCPASACRVHALCAALRPDLQPLASHSSYRSCSHFAFAVRILEVHIVMTYPELHRIPLITRVSCRAMEAPLGT